MYERLGVFSKDQTTFVVCLEDGTLAWYDQGTEGIAHQLVYLHFIPPSPKDEAGQDRRKISIHILYLDANSKIRQVCSRPLQSRQLKAGHFSKRFFKNSTNWVFLQNFSPVELEYPSQYFRIRFCHHIEQIIILVPCSIFNTCMSQRALKTLSLSELQHENTNALANTQRQVSSLSVLGLSSSINKRL